MSEPICKGSILLLSACQRCSRCREERDNICQKLSVAPKQHKAVTAFAVFMAELNHSTAKLQDALKDVTP
jgi:hypothetical protein